MGNTYIHTDRHTCMLKYVCMHSCIKNIQAFGRSHILESQDTLPSDLFCNVNCILFIGIDSLVGLVVKTYALRAADPGFDFRFLRGDFATLINIM